MYCSKCGHKNIDGAIFCEACGQRIEDESLKEAEFNVQQENPVVNQDYEIGSNTIRYDSIQSNSYEYLDRNEKAYVKTTKKKKKHLLIIGVLVCLVSICGVAYYFLNSSDTKNTIKYEEVKSEQSDLVVKKDKDETVVDKSLAFYDGVRTGNKKKWEKSINLLSDPKIRDIGFSSLKKYGTFLERYIDYATLSVDSETAEKISEMSYLVTEGTGTIKDTGDNFKWVHYSAGEDEFAKEYMEIDIYDLFLTDDNGNEIPVTTEPRLLILGTDLKSITFEYVDNRDAFYGGTYTDDDVKEVTVALNKYLVDDLNKLYLQRLGYDLTEQDIYVVPFLSTSIEIPLVLKTVTITSISGEKRILKSEDSKYEVPIYDGCNFYDFNNDILNEKGNLAIKIAEDIYDIMNETKDYSYVNEINKLLGENYFQQKEITNIENLLAMMKDDSFEDLGLSNILDSIATLEQKGPGFKVKQKDLFRKK